MRLLTLATAIFVNGLHVQANIGPPGITSSMPPPPALSSPTILSDNPEVVPTMPAPPSNTTELAIVTQFENLRVNAKTLLRFDPESSTNMLSGAVVALAMIPEGELSKPVCRNQFVLLAQSPHCDGVCSGCWSSAASYCADNSS